MAQSTTPLQNSYCDVKKASRSATLPNFEDFKKNTDNVQRLLLKREAERYGVVLPAETPAPREIERNDSSNIAHRLPSLKQCELNSERIACEKEYYALAVNQKNNQLKAEAFSSYNELRLPRKEETNFATESDYRYLSHIYPDYIYKMLEIGLGDSTMSFTKFATVYWQSKMEGLDFSERFRTVYNQLKLEKSQNQIRPRYTSSFPADIHQCMRLDAKIIVCDDMTKNWVYRLL